VIPAIAPYAYLVAGWLLLVGAFGIVRSRDLVHAVVCLSVAQSGTYVLLVAIGYQQGAAPPVFGSTTPPSAQVTDPLVQAMTLTDIVVSATVTALLLALTVQVAKRHGTVDPDELRSLRG
jgi:multicomponent Na+:H+ antiporter subunit C